MKKYAFLDVLDESLESGGYALIDGPVRIEQSDLAVRLIRIANVDDVQTVARTDYGLSAKVTRLQLSQLYGKDDSLLLTASDQKLRGLQATLYTVQSERVGLAPEPIADPVDGDRIMLDGSIPNLSPAG